MRRGGERGAGEGGRERCGCGNVCKGGGSQRLRGMAATRTRRNLVMHNNNTPRALAGI